MAYVFRREIVIPLWVLGFCTLALSIPPPRTSTFVTLVAGAGLALGLAGMVRWWRRSSIAIAAGARSRTLEETLNASRSDRAKSDALDLVRMDDDGWQMPPIDEHPRNIHTN